jgi:hypothetical protein
MATFDFTTTTGGAYVTYNLAADSVFGAENIEALTEIGERYSEVRETLAAAAKEARDAIDDEIRVLQIRESQVRELHVEAIDALARAEREERDAAKAEALGRQTTDES